MAGWEDSGREGANSVQLSIVSECHLCMYAFALVSCSTTWVKEGTLRIMECVPPVPGNARIVAFDMVSEHAFPH